MRRGNWFTRGDPYLHATHEESWREGCNANDDKVLNYTAGIPLGGSSWHWHPAALTPKGLGLVSPHLIYPQLPCLEGLCRSSGGMLAAWPDVTWPTLLMPRPPKLESHNEFRKKAMRPAYPHLLTRQDAGTSVEWRIQHDVYHRETCKDEVPPEL